MPTDSATTTQADDAAQAQKSPNGAPGTQADQGTQPPAGSSSTQADGGSGDDDQPLTGENARKLRNEARRLRERLRRYEDQDGSPLTSSEQQRLAGRVTDLEGKLSAADAREKDRRIADDATTTASKLSFRSPALAHRLIDRSELTFDGDGRPTNVEKLLKAIAEAHPELVKPGADYGGGDRGTAPGGVDMNTLIRRGAGRGT